MGIERVDYIITGMAILNPVVIKKFFEDTNNILDQYDDNPHKKEISDTGDNNDIHVISDGMNGKYVIIGRIIEKALDYSGISLTRIGSEEFSDIEPELDNVLRNIDDKMGTTLIKYKEEAKIDSSNFIYIGTFVFTHWF